MSDIKQSNLEKVKMEIAFQGPNSQNILKNKFLLKCFLLLI